MTEHPDVACPSCGAPATKVFNASGIKFEGSGFYNTDERGGSSATSATSGASTAEKGASTPSSCENCPHSNA